ncbi:MAG: sensor histidine kinase [Stackebrandtia sp.]
MRPWWNRPLVVDGLLAVGLAVVISVTTIAAQLGDRREPLADGVAIACIVVTCAFLTFRRRRPLLTLLGVFAATMGYALLDYPYGPIFLAIAVALGNYTSRCPRRTAIVVTVVMALAHLPYSIISGREPDDSIALNIIISVTWIAASGAIGVFVKQTRDNRLRAKEEERLRLAGEERLRIAREVHDVVGHSLTAINMHARLALHVLRQDDVEVPAAVTQSLTAIRESGSEALDELRATLAPLTPGYGSTERPVLTLADIESAMAAALSGDLFIDVNIDGERGAIPAVVDSAGYRIVQESLTNVVKHAGASRAVVDIGYAPGLVTVTVTDNGHGGHAVDGRGSGMAGMTERAESLGGSFHAGPRDAGGFAVRAELPYARVER